MNRSTQITSGKFASGENQKGNFTGYNAAGERIFIHKNQMESLGWKSDKDVKFPFYAVIGEKDIQTRDENGELTAVMVKRLQALSVFSEKAALIDALTADKRIELEAQAALVASAKSAGLTEKQLSALLEAAV